MEKVRFLKASLIYNEIQNEKIDKSNDLSKVEKIWSVFILNINS